MVALHETPWEVAQPSATSVDVLTRPMQLEEKKPDDGGQR